MNPRSTLTVEPQNLGSPAFRRAHNLKYAYLTGGMYRGISSKEMVVTLGKSGLMGFLGAGGLSLEAIENAIVYVRKHLTDKQAHGVNLLHSPHNPMNENKIVMLCLKHGVTRIEAAAFTMAAPALVHFRLKGLRKALNGKIAAPNKIIAKVSHPEVAKLFMSPPQETIVKDLLAQGKINHEEAELAQAIPVSADICIEADSAGHTSRGNPMVLLPAIKSLRDEMVRRYAFGDTIRIGLAGGIGTPEAVASAFIMDADFILTGSINQCTVESGTSELVKTMLESIDVHDTDYAPAGDMFEMGAKVQVLKKGLLFPARAKKLYALYENHDSLDDLPADIKNQIEQKYFKKSFEEIWRETKRFILEQGDIAEIIRAESTPKYKMALIFRWYFGRSTRLALDGDERFRVDFQIHTGPALGAFNQWVKGTELEKWRSRHVDRLADALMEGAASIMNRKISELAFNRQ